MIDKNKVYEATYETIKENLEWGLGEKDYSYFVDGVIAMTETLLNKFQITTTTTATSGYIAVAEYDNTH